MTFDEQEMIGRTPYNCEICGELIERTGYDMDGVIVCEDCIDDYMDEYLEDHKIDCESINIMYGAKRRS